MHFQLWRDVRGFWSVCEGPLHLGVAGYIIQKNNRTWAIDGDQHERTFLDQVSAASAVLGRELPPGVQFYELHRGSDTAYVATYDDVLQSILTDGWTLISSSRTL
jgi:hypothetical protein